MLVMLNDQQKYGEPRDGGGGAPHGMEAQLRRWFGGHWGANLKGRWERKRTNNNFCAESGDALELPLGRVRKEAERTGADLGGE